MPVVIIVVAVVILGGVVVAAMGRGGELGRDRPELPARSEFRTWSDVAGYRPPPALLGYHAGATEHALSLIARTIAERDAEIDWLRERLAAADRLRSGPDSETGGQLASPAAGAGLEPGAGSAADDAAGTEGWPPGAVPGPASAPAALRAPHSPGGRPGEDA